MEITWAKEALIRTSTVGRGCPDDASRVCLQETDVSSSAKHWLYSVVWDWTVLSG